MMQRLLPVAVLVFALLTVVGCSAADEPVPAPEPTPGEASGLDGEALLQTKCTVCHTLDQVLAEEADAVGWAAIIDEMIAKGAQVTDEEAAAIAEYLANR